MSLLRTQREWQVRRILLPLHPTKLNPPLSVRRAMDVGAHRKSRQRWSSPLQDQHRRRAWVTTLAWDRWLSAMLGRPHAVQDEDIDVELPLDLSDGDLYEWERQAQVAQALNQPRPPPPLSSSVNSWSASHQIHQLIAAATSLHSPGRDQGQTARRVAALDARLNEWALQHPPDFGW
jgi:hypothetical protein